VRTIRYPRIEKFRSKTKRLSFFLKLTSIWYILIGTGIYLTSNTNASFNDVKTISYQIQTQGETTDAQWDNSSLQFVKGKSGFDCNTYFYQQLINNGAKMQGTSTYVVYYQNSGSAPNSNNPGTEVFRGTIPALNSGESIRLIYKPTGLPGTGTYKFMAFQRSGHPGQGDLWGDGIQVSDTQIKACTQ
jgi:YqxM protein